MQIIASRFRQEELEDADHRALALRNEECVGKLQLHTSLLDDRNTPLTLIPSCSIPPPEQVSYYSRFAQLYREAINRYLLEISVSDWISQNGDRSQYMF